MGLAHLSALLATTILNFRSRFQQEEKHVFGRWICADRPRDTREGRRSAFDIGSVITVLFVFLAGSMVSGCSDDQIIEDKETCVDAIKSRTEANKAYVAFFQPEVEASRPVIDQLLDIFQLKKSPEDRDRLRAGLLKSCPNEEFRVLYDNRGKLGWKCRVISGEYIVDLVIRCSRRVAVSDAIKVPGPQ